MPEAKKPMEDGVEFFPGAGWRTIFGGGVCARRLNSKDDAETYLARLKGGLARFEHVTTERRFDEGRPSPRH